MSPVTRKVEAGWTVETRRSSKQGLMSSRRAEQADPGNLYIASHLHTVSQMLNKCY